MNDKYFFTVKYIHKNIDDSYLSGKCIGILHGLLAKRRQSHIGVSFPNWSDKSIGESIAFVSSDLKILAQLRCQEYFQHMKNDGVFEVTDVNAVPVNSQPIRFIRNQRVAKIFPGYTKRINERLIARAKERDDKIKVYAQARIVDIPPYHGIHLSSSTNGQNFKIFIQREDVTNYPEKNAFSSYGLSNKKFDGAVPDLSS